MKFKVSKCCYYINLRFGCFLVVFLDICLHAMYIDLGNHEYLNFLKPFIYVSHFVGCLMLLYSATVQISLLILVYLTTDVLKMLFFVISAHGWILNCQNSIFTRIMHVVNILLSIYYWLVAYSYYLQCRDNSANNESPLTLGSSELNTLRPLAQFIE